MAINMWDMISNFIFGAVFAHLITRIPFITFPRLKTWNEQFPPHPEPIYVDGHLIQRVLHMRMFYWLAIIFAVIPLFFGWASLRYGSASLGFGMWAVSCWLILNRLTAFISSEDAPWSKKMAVELQIIRNECDSEQSCCSIPHPVWQITAIRCTNCGMNLKSMPRPDLGRPRKDGKIRGFVRLLLTDGRPIVANEDQN